MCSSLKDRVCIMGDRGVGKTSLIELFTVAKDWLETDILDLSAGECVNQVLIGISYKM